jgi:hypothetical protein
MKSALLFAAMLAAAPASAQAVLDDFGDDDFSNVFVFSGTNAGIGVFDADGALGVGIDPAQVGAFAGFGVGVPGGGVVDVSGQAVMRLPISSVPDGGGTTQPFTLEVNLQEDVDGNGTFDGDTEDEFQATLQVTPDGEQRAIEIPLSAFVDDNSNTAGADDGFDFSRLLQVVFAIGGADGLGDPFTVRIDRIDFGDGGPVTPGELSLNDFEDGDLSEVFAFSGAGGAGVELSVTDGAAGTQNGLAVQVDPAATGDFAGFGFSGPSGGNTDASGAQAFTFYLRATSSGTTQPFTLEVNLQEDANGDGEYQGDTEDDFQATTGVAFGPGGYALVSIPISAFADDNSVNVGANDGFDYSQVRQVVFAIGGASGLGSAFELSVDEVAFAGMGTASEPGPSAALDVAAFPNPTAGPARVTFSLATASRVTADVVDLLGRRVLSLSDGPRPAGPVRLDVPSESLPPGAYVVRVWTDSGVSTARLTIVR